MKHVYFLCWVALFSTALISCQQVAENKCDKVLFSAKDNGQKLPLLTQCDAQFDMQSAYVTQKKYVNHILEGDKVAGFKAGLTSEKAQQKFGAKSALFGVLFQSGKMSNGDKVIHQEFGFPMVEIELGYRLSRPVSDTVSLEELKGIVSEVVAVIELPDLAYEDMKKLKAADIVASNVASSRYIIGESQPLEGMEDLNGLELTLFENNQLINKGKATDAMQNQWVALQWLINNAISNGYQIKSSDLLITGAIGKMLPLKKGIYKANYGELLGEIAFEVK